MKFICDEGVERPIVLALRERGYTILYIAELDPGITDDEVLALAAAEQSPLITNDKDFGELVFRQGLVSAGVMLLRLEGLATHAKAEVVVAAVSDHSNELPGSFTVVSRRQVRIRRQPK